MQDFEYLLVAKAASLDVKVEAIKAAIATKIVENAEFDYDDAFSIMMSLKAEDLQ
ncbi:hypothetical protein [Vibrio superstes]|uniref:Uncharacterized protein n=1 Tax=Vibrio superstes NBRC 103154 TaxID=1219062 RepID=A0A511QRR4_9VIBR|nr:hypothetical protein [Vibrio superstes]GEM79576.1 hypothetical protein VSU01S_18210 [Vibrio superstes NBRC 103154]